MRSGDFLRVSFCKRIYERKEKMDFIPLNLLIRNQEQYWAHTKKSGEGEIIGHELLEEHIERCQKNFCRLLKEKNIERIFERFYSLQFGNTSDTCQVIFWSMLANIITFHDLGKINPNFQSAIMQNPESRRASQFNSLGSKHSCISAVLYMDYYDQQIMQLSDRSEKKLLKYFMVMHSYTIDRHHSSLSSMNDYMHNLENGKESDAVEILGEDTGVYIPAFQLNGERIRKLCNIVYQCREKQSRKENIWLYIYEKLLYSLLVASDYYATAEFEAGLCIQQAGNLDDIKVFMRIYDNTEISRSIRNYERTSYPKEREELAATKDINMLRTEMFLDVERELKKHIDQNIFYLEAPTGGGKSNISMNLSFQLMRNAAFLHKIYYVYPFNTLVEQNRRSLEKTFGNNEELRRQIAVVNSITPIKRIEEKRKKEAEDECTAFYEEALLDRQFLNYPIVLTTHVSLFDTMFGDAKESAFAFHQLVGSVIVLDEIQSYKNEIWGEMISFLKEMAAFMNMKIIIMSATLPNLHLLADNAEGTVQLICDRKKYFEHRCFKDRVKTDYSLLEQEFQEDLLMEHVKSNLIGPKKILMEFIKKNTANEFYQRAKAEIESETVLVFYMSGEDSLLERSKILSAIKKNSDKAIVLIATQVIEAGVDIDMDIGYKNISMFDSEEQFIGRINRSFLHENGTAYFFKADEPKSVYRGEIRLNQEFMITDAKMQNIFRNKDFPEYYRSILQVIKANLNDLHNERGLETFFRDFAGGLNFPAVKERMKLIDDTQWSMSVYLARKVEDENGKIIDGSQLWEEYRDLLENNEMGYAEKRVKLSDVTSKMNGFIYQIKKKADFAYDDLIGEIFYVEKGEKYFDNGKLNRKRIQGEIGEFVDFI